MARSYTFSGREATATALFLALARGAAIELCRLGVPTSGVCLRDDDVWRVLSHVSPVKVGALEQVILQRHDLGSHARVAGYERSGVFGGVDKAYKAPYCRKPGAILLALGLKWPEAAAGLDVRSSVLEWMADIRHLLPVEDAPRF